MAINTKLQKDNKIQKDKRTKIQQVQWINDKWTYGQKNKEQKSKRAKGQKYKYIKTRTKGQIDKGKKDIKTKEQKNKIIIGQISNDKLYFTKSIVIKMDALLNNACLNADILNVQNFTQPDFR